MFSQDLIITTYNSQDHIKELNKQINYLKNFFEKIIIIDDCSCDNTIEHLKNKIDKNIVLLKNKSNMGPSFCRNLGAKFSNSDYISFLDSDDIFSKQKYNIIKSFCDIYKPDILFHDYKIIKKRKFNTKKESYKFKIQKNYKFLFKSIYVTPAFTIKRQIFLKENGYNEKIRYAEDLELYIRLREKYFFYFLDIPLVGIYKTSTSQSSNRRKMRLNIMKILLKKISKLNFLSFLLIISFSINLCKFLINR